MDDVIGQISDKNEIKQIPVDIWEDISEVRKVIHPDKSSKTNLPFADKDFLIFCLKVDEIDLDAKQLW